MSPGSGNGRVQGTSAIVHGATDHDDPQRCTLAAPFKHGRFLRVHMMLVSGNDGSAEIDPLDRTSPVTNPFAGT